MDAKQRNSMTSMELQDRLDFLNSFQKLPPDISLAAIKIEEEIEKRSELLSKKQAILESMASTLR